MSPDRATPPTVSVLLPTHNRPAWLAEALDSVLCGKFRDLEVIVSNNGDPQHTRRLETAIQDPRVRWVEQGPALGMLDNFLAALSLARGKHVAVLHDDDRWSPAFLSTLVPPLELYPEAVLAFADIWVTDERGKVDADATEVNTRRCGRAHLRGGLHQPFFDVVARASVVMTACVFRRTAVSTADITSEVGSFYDTWTSYLLARGGGAAYYTPERLVYYRSHGDQLTHTAHAAQHAAAARCRQVMLDDPVLRPYAGLIRDQLARDHRHVGGALLRQGKRRAARRHLEAAIRSQPTVKALAGWTASWLAPTGVLKRI
jgi:glycosyltransferase involved in cell wall biosynthesis